MIELQIVTKDISFFVLQTAKSKMLLSLETVPQCP